jgi:hypothetical protein
VRHRRGLVLDEGVFVSAEWWFLAWVTAGLIFALGWWFWHGRTTEDLLDGYRDDDET